MTLTGRYLWMGLGASAALGVAVGTFASGWNRARGIQGTEASADAGAVIQVDAGVAARSDCGAIVEHWTTVRVPGPTRYLPAPDGGQAIAQPPEVVTVLVPDVRLTGSADAIASLEALGRGEAGASAKAVPAAPERHWEIGPLVLYRKTWDVTVPDSLSAGAALGYSGGPFGVRILGATDGKSLTAGALIVWRW